jgi:hypothetical protein
MMQPPKLHIFLIPSWQLAFDFAPPPTAEIYLGYPESNPGITASQVDGVGKSQVYNQVLFKIVSNLINHYYWYHVLPL